MEKKRVTVLVAGQQFTILTEEKNEKYVIDIASKIDAHITSLTMSNLSREKAAVLTALDYADDMEQLKRENTDIREQIKDYIRELASLHEENDRLQTLLKKQNEKLAESPAVSTEAPAPPIIEKAPPALAEAAPAAVSAKTTPEPPIAPASPAPAITAEDDLFFGEPAVVKPKKKQRHEHNHENPYRRQFLQKQNKEKGYIPDRQYTLFDEDE